MISGLRSTYSNETLVRRLILLTSKCGTHHLLCISTSFRHPKAGWNTYFGYFQPFLLIFRCFLCFFYVFQPFQVKIYWKRLKINNKGWQRPKKYFDQLSSECSTQKLVKIHNNYPLVSQNIQQEITLPVQQPITPV